MLLGDVASTRSRVAATTKRSEKTAALADLFRQAAPTEVGVLVGFLVGELRQGALGVGWATVSKVVETPAPDPGLEILDVHATFSRLQATSGPGSAARRHSILAELFARASGEEQELLRRLVVGDLRQGALAGLVTDAVAKAAGVPAPALRRAAMFSGDLGLAATVAFVEGRQGLDGIGLEVLRPVQPMLASTAESVSAAIDDLGEASVEWKLDGIRVQVHRRGDDVRVYTRNLNDVTERVPEVVVSALTFDAERFVLDGEVIGAGAESDGDRPEAFQDTASRFGRDDATTHSLELAPGFFDILHLDGVDLVDEPLRHRRTALEELVGSLVIPGAVTADPVEGARVLEQALAAGHEGVMVKGVDSLYAAGRRGKAWRKVKPVHTLDLMVLGAEWGHGRRQGWLSNLHLGARDSDGGFVMVGKTFKGLTDELLAWQTEELQTRRVSEEGIAVFVRHELVVEIAVDGVQSSTRYPGGVALRFARVKRYRSDKGPSDVDTIDSVRAML